MVMVSSIGNDGGRPTGQFGQEHGGARRYTPTNNFCTLPCTLHDTHTHSIRSFRFLSHHFYSCTDIAPYETPPLHLPLD